MDNLSSFEKSPAYSEPKQTIIAPVRVAKSIINCGSGKGKKINEVIKLIIAEFGFKVAPIFDKKKDIKNPEILITDIGNLKKIGFFPRKKFEVGVKEYVSWFKKKFI